MSGRRLLMFNGDIEVFDLQADASELEGFYRNGEGDEVLYIHRGGGVLRTCSDACRSASTTTS